MDARISDAGSHAIFSEEGCCRETGSILPEKIWFALACKKLWPDKASAALEDLAGCADRTARATARAYASGHNEPSATVLRDLLRSREGFRVLRAVLGDDPPAWFATLKSDFELGQSVRKIVNDQLLP